ncbi:hypothetical protein CBR_g11049 [Chara braunii]|uniref:Cyclin N-terminal domain-containing protein n=1 Tax=Chara braunii TaxID=69332 RepID=A0A388KPZ9_CHABU|nr:hypothetical protein CBR_g11049 [Chara braunii]|eukprot:GBG72116.1 hypothetical protein CBR_g11049 [Chara braunii]
MAFVGTKDNGVPAAGVFDENKKIEVKAIKAAGRVAAQNQTTAARRRALGDIGNLVRAIQQGQQGKGNLQQGQQGKEAELRGELPNGESASDKPSAVQSKPIPIPQPTTDAHLPPVRQWGVTRPRNYGSKPQKQGATAARLARRSRPSASVAQEKGELSMTSLLTAWSEEACGGFQDIEDGETATDIDSNDKGDIRHVVDYVEDIYSFYRKAEIHSTVEADYMTSQADINEKMRAILLDWLVEVHFKFKLLPETLYLTANLIDRYLAKKPTERKNLQLVGITAMLIASKYEEIWAPEVQDFVYISDKAYTKAAILDMEKKMLNTLNFNLTVPTPYVFMVRFLKAAEADKKLEHLAFFLVELALVEYRMVKFLPSHLAAAAVYTAMRTLGRLSAGWSATLRRHSGYAEEALKQCASLMAGFHKNASSTTLVAVHKKYSGPKFSEVAKIGPCLELTDTPGSAAVY